MIKKMSGYEENKILGMAMELEKKGEEWVNLLRQDNNFVKNNSPILEISSQNKCPIHSVKDLEWIRLKIPFFPNERNSASIIKIPINYCKYCRKLYLDEKYYDKYKSKGEFLCKLSKKNILVNDLTAKVVKEWNQSYSEQRILGLCSIEEENVKFLLSKEKKRAEIPIIRENGEIEYFNVPVYYSKNTGYCYIYKETVQRLKTVGVINCKLIKATCEENYTNEISNLNEESLLYQYGYNVAESNNLSKQQRRQILVSLLQQDILKMEEIKNHLSFLINVNKNVLKMKSACEKWKSDFNFLDDYEKNMFEITSPSQLIVRSVIVDANKENNIV